MLELGITQILQLGRVVTLNRIVDIFFETSLAIGLPGSLR